MQLPSMSEVAAALAFTCSHASCWGLLAGTPALSSVVRVITCRMASAHLPNPSSPSTCHTACHTHASFPLPPADSAGPLHIYFSLPPLFFFFFFSLFSLLNQFTRHSHCSRCSVGSTYSSSFQPIHFIFCFNFSSVSDLVVVQSRLWTSSSHHFCLTSTSIPVQGHCRWSPSIFFVSHNGHLLEARCWPPGPGCLLL